MKNLNKTLESFLNLDEGRDCYSGFKIKRINLVKATTLVNNLIDNITIPIQEPEAFLSSNGSIQLSWYNKPIKTNPVLT